MRLRFLLLPLLCLLSAGVSPLSAQEKLKINEFYTTEFQERTGVSAIDMQGVVFPEWGPVISLFRSLKVTSPKDIERIEKAVKQDAVGAVARTSSVVDGRIVYGWYGLPPLHKDLNRYIIYVHASEGPATLIYMEGTIPPIVFKERIQINYMPKGDEAVNLSF